MTETCLWTPNCYGCIWTKFTSFNTTNLRKVPENQTNKQTKLQARSFEGKGKKHQPSTSVCWVSGNHHGNSVTTATQYSAQKVSLRVTPILNLFPLLFDLAKSQKGLRVETTAADEVGYEGLTTPCHVTALCLTLCCRGDLFPWILVALQFTSLEKCEEKRGHHLFISKCCRRGIKFKLLPS